MAAYERPKQKATFADLAKLEDRVSAEIIHGDVVEKASPSFEHGALQFALGSFLGQFSGRGGGGRPGGWWVASEVEVEYEAHEIFRHDGVGWRRDRVAKRPTGRPVKIPPDWVAEILSPSNEKRDLVDKFRVLQRHAVPHYWVLNADEKILVVHRLENDRYVVALTAAAGETVRAEPFDAVELDLSVLFGVAEE